MSAATATPTTTPTSSDGFTGGATLSLANVMNNRDYIADREDLADLSDDVSFGSKSEPTSAPALHTVDQMVIINRRVDDCVDTVADCFDSTTDNIFSIISSAATVDEIGLCGGS